MLNLLFPVIFGEFAVSYQHYLNVGIEIINLKTKQNLTKLTKFVIFYLTLRR